MKELFRYISNLGWYGGLLEFDFRIEGRFEGWHGKASETWEYRYIAESKGIGDTKGTWVLPPIKMVSDRYETIDDFATRVLDKIKKQQS